jgi:hypothetical protein
MRQRKKRNGVPIIQSKIEDFQHSPLLVQPFICNRRTSKKFEEMYDKKILVDRKITDQAWLIQEYVAQKISFETAVERHLEVAQPLMFNNLSGFLTVRLLLDMTTSRKVNKAALKRTKLGSYLIEKKISKAQVYE